MSWDVGSGVVVIDVVIDVGGSRRPFVAGAEEDGGSACGCSAGSDAGRAALVVGKRERSRSLSP